MSAGLVTAEFDSAIFGFPWYRLPVGIDADLDALASWLRARVSPDSPRLGADTKLAASNLDLLPRLLGIGFREVCLQLTWERRLSDEDAVRPPAAAVGQALNLDDTAVRRHASGFTYDRFHQDPDLPQSSADALFAAWIGNSLRGGKQVTSSGDGFCTFSVCGEVAAIDLLSVLTPGRGTGTRVVCEAISESRRQGASQIRVTTEAANDRAWLLYQRLGFRLIATTRSLHLHLRQP